MRIYPILLAGLSSALLLASGSRGGRSVPRSYAAPRPPSYSVPRAPSYSAPKAPSYSAPRPPSYSAPKAPAVPRYKPSPAPKQTYKGGDGTRYYAGETYKGSGLPKVDRNQGAKQKFLREKGLSKAPPGTEIDHITPLSKGGSDTPQNMEILTKDQHRKKTAQERQK